jgi:hypothetical protein
MIRDVLHLARAAGTELGPVRTPTAAPAAGDDVQKELAALQGEWLLVYWLFNGNEQPARERKIIWTFVGEQFTIRSGETVELVIYKRLKE